MRSFQDERVLSGTPLLGKPEGFVSPSPGLPRGGAGGEATLGQPAASSSNSEGVAPPHKRAAHSIVHSFSEGGWEDTQALRQLRQERHRGSADGTQWLGDGIPSSRGSTCRSREFPLACKPHRLYTLSDRTKTMSTRMDNAAQALPGARTSGTPLEPVRIPNCGPLHRRSMAGKRQTHFFPSPPDITGEDAPSGPDRPVGGCKSLPISLVKPSRRT